MPKPVLATPTFRVPVADVPGPRPVYPILRYAKKDGGIETDSLPGSAFFISESGLFLTAGHVVDDDPGASEYRIFFYEESRYSACEFELEKHPQLDVAVGIAPFPPGYTVQRCKLSGARLLYNEHLVTYGYGEHVFVEHEGTVPGSKGLTMNFWPMLREGRILDFAEAGERTPKGCGPAYVHSAYTPGGNSGGPLIDPRTSAVHGIMSSGTCGPTRQEDYSYAVAVEGILDWRLGLVGGATLRELAAAGLVALAE